MAGFAAVGRQGSRAARAASVFAVAALLLTACGSSSKPTASSSANNKTAGTVVGSSYKLMFMSDIASSGGAAAAYVDAFDADLKAANIRGGIAGHQIQLITCDTDSSDNAAAACGQEAVTDHVFAVISESGEDTFFPYLQKAGIPIFNEGIGTISWTSPVSF